MTPNEKWLHMLSNLNIDATDELLDGKLLKRELSKDNKSWRLTLEFKNILPFDVMNFVTSKIREYVFENFSADDCKFKIQYENNQIQDEYIYDYYIEAVKLFGKMSKEMLILNRYTISIINSVINFSVATEDEQQILSKKLSLITKYFNNYGLSNVTFNITVSKDEYDIKKQHEIEFNVKEQIDTAKVYEAYNEKVLNQKSQESVSEYSGYKKKSSINVNIDEIPFTSIEVAEFAQINGTSTVEVSGVVVKTECRHITSKNGHEYDLFTGIITNYKDSVMFKRFYRENEKTLFEKEIKESINITVVGTVEWDNFANSVVIMCNKIIIKGENKYRTRFDGQENKRIELHAHSKMSVLDSILNIEEYVAQAKHYGHKAIAITDHENCHVLPEFFKLAKKSGIKPIAGLEASYVDTSRAKIALTNDDISLNSATYVVFDIETTGLCIEFNEIIEIGAIKVQNGLIIDSFQEFVKPKKKVSTFIENLTDITNDDLYDALTIEEVLPAFKEFIQGAILVGHNASFDCDFIYYNMKQLGIFDHVYPCIDTIAIARCLYTQAGLKRLNLGAVAKYLKVEVEQQHRAIHDAKTTTNVFMKMLGDISNQGINNYKDLNNIIKPNEIYKYEHLYHLNILVKNRKGLKNMYKIISDSQTNHYYKGARLTKDVLMKYRDDLLIGSGCVNGEVFRAAYEKTEDVLRERIKFYDYIEVQPPCLYKFLYENTKDEGSYEYVLETIKKIIRVAKEEGKIVVATGDVHELISEDSQFRKIYLSVARPNGGGPHELAKYDPLDMHYRNTTEMLKEFNFLPYDLAYEIVVTNTNYINDQIEEYDLFPKKLFVPEDNFRADHGIPSMKQAIYDLCKKNSTNKYGENIPLYVKERLDTELEAIIGHGYFSVYYISHLLVKDSNDHGYVVGSRGSVGSSFVATMMNITEVNALKPHYVCKKCKYSAFKFTEEEKIKYQQFDVPSYLEEALQSADSGYDLKEAKCPKCGTLLSREGMNIAFETFLGFTGEKCPDIDLNFSGEYQASAHLFVQNTFGKEYAFRAGTISTVMDKTAYAYVRDYYNLQGIEKRQQELDRLALFLVGSKKTTGQHPGGIVVVPNYIDIYDITPIQFPPVSDKDDLEQLQWRTTHFDYHTFEANLLKLDILGHDDPTLIKKLIEYVHLNPDDFPFSNVEDIPFIDDKVISLFSSKDALEIEGDDLDTLTSGTIGMPEFGTNFVRGMLNTIKPKTYHDIVKVSGLSHGTDVWAGNAESLVQGSIEGFPKIEFSEIIGCRDDIMIYLIKKNLDAALSFKIMEAVRKGKGLEQNQIEAMRKVGVPEWFIWSCKKIKYLFPKAHAVAYVIMSLRIGWFKVHRAIYYYAVYFSVRAKELDAEVFAMGKNAIRNKIQEIEKKIKDREQTNKDENLLDELKIALEMVLRGYSFKQIDINYSEATTFVISKDKKSLYLPFVAIPSLGESVANSVIEARKVRPFSSKKDFERRTSINKTQYAKLALLGVFDDLPEDDINTLF